MKKLTWAKVTAVITLAYGVFLIVQSFFFTQIWPREEIHNSAMLVSGILLIGWSLVFWKLKAR